MNHNTDVHKPLRKSPQKLEDAPGQTVQRRPSELGSPDCINEARQASFVRQNQSHGQAPVPSLPQRRKSWPLLLLLLIVARGAGRAQTGPRRHRRQRRAWRKRKHVPQWNSPRICIQSTKELKEE